MSPDLDLFEWAASRPTATVIDASHLFLRREVAFYRLLIIGYQPPTSGGAAPIDFAAYRQARAERAANECDNEQRAAQ
ncbi:hypothetical protein AKG11_03765 [Shinella sp. SUS2]|uniref:hypothetical protein n=1 Tax=unclassified Shinella TaxID=2643062 RepID=UPI0006816524|nr:MULTISPECIES: hypothetical protein [unclassified Shinella]KNY18258.1 hypothetical protein AKG11_03765 [Shinella sp. SUS2]KOC77453.1 hypothetical protein AKG10_01235 [Shinella sp. GWS1]